MKTRPLLALLTTLGCVCIGCAGSAAETETPGGRATAAIDGTTYAVSDVKLSFQPGEDGYFRIEGRDAKHPDEDCLPGLGGGIGLYGGLPSGVTELADLSGRELPFEFTGDGDDFNLCFVGSQGLLGVESGTVKFSAVDKESVQFTFRGQFVRYDGDGGEVGDVRASGNGIAIVE